VYAALETYSNVHRGSGPCAQVTTDLFERAREIILGEVGLDDGAHILVFCSPRAADRLASRLKPGGYQVVSSRDIGLPIGIRALAFERQGLSQDRPFESGGGTVKMVSPASTVQEDAPGRFEPGTPAVLNAIALANALQLTRTFGPDAFRVGANVSEADAAYTAARILRHDELAGDSGRRLLDKLKMSVVGREVKVPISDGLSTYVNLDNAASTRTFWPVWEAVRQTCREPELVQREIVEQVREIAADFLGAPLREYDIIFTGNTTEAINIVAQCLSYPQGDLLPVVLNTLGEHNSNELPWRQAGAAGLVRLPVDEEGFVDISHLEEVLREYNELGAHGDQRIRLVAVSGGSNVLGVCNDLQAISRLAHLYGALILVDGAQLVARRSVAMADSGIDFLALSAHKMYAPFGSGALVARKGLLDRQPQALAAAKASGEENAPGIAALGKAMLLLERVGLDIVEEEESKLTRLTLRGLARLPGVRVYGVKDERSPRFGKKIGVITFGLEGMPHNMVAKELAELGGIGVRSGCFCAPLLVKWMLRIHPLRARAANIALRIWPRLSANMLPGLIRISLGLENSRADIDQLLHALEQISLAPRSAATKLAAALHSGSALLPGTETQARIAAFSQSISEKVYPAPAVPVRVSADKRTIHPRRMGRKPRCCSHCCGLRVLGGNEA
jgi:selenocysteine lyase/cysteine desulfurase